MRLHLGRHRYLRSPGPGARPTVGELGRRNGRPGAAGSRWSCRAARRTAVVAALRQAHPYEEPAFDVYELAPWSGPARDRPGRAASRRRRRCASSRCWSRRRCRAPRQGVRIAGDPMGEVSRVAVCGGAGDSLLDAVRASGADVFVTADLRHHPASEAREAAGESRPVPGRRRALDERVAVAGRGREPARGGAGGGRDPGRGPRVRQVHRPVDVPGAEPGRRRPLTRPRPGGGRDVGCRGSPTAGRPSTRRCTTW